eukprot:2613267-Prymnesium_polylepis.1
MHPAGLQREDTRQRAAQRGGHGDSCGGDMWEETKERGCPASGVALGSGGVADTVASKGASAVPAHHATYQNHRRHALAGVCLAKMENETWDGRHAHGT